MSVVHGPSPLISGTPIAHGDVPLKEKNDIYANNNNGNGQWQAEKFSSAANTLHGQNGNFSNQPPLLYNEQSDNIKSLNGFSHTDQVANQLQGVHLSSRGVSSHHLPHGPLQEPLQPAHSISPQQNTFPPSIQSNSFSNLQASSVVSPQRFYSSTRMASTSVMYTSFPRSSVPTIQAMSGAFPHSLNSQHANTAAHSDPYLPDGIKQPGISSGTTVSPVKSTVSSPVIGVSDINKAAIHSSGTVPSNNLIMPQNSSFPHPRYNPPFKSDGISPRAISPANSTLLSPTHYSQPRPIVSPTNMPFPPPVSSTPHIITSPSGHATPLMASMRPMQQNAPPVGSIAQLPVIANLPTTNAAQFPLNSGISSTNNIGPAPPPPPPPLPPLASTQSVNGFPSPSAAYTNMGLDCEPPLTQGMKQPFIPSPNLTQHSMQSHLARNYPPHPSQQSSPSHPQYPPPPPNIAPVSNQNSGSSLGAYNAQPFNQNRTLNLDLLPSVIQVREEENKNQSGPFCTDVNGQVPPLATTNFIAQDRGNCNPRFMRSTIYSLPIQPDVLKQTAIPFTVSISPFAKLSKGEVPPPICDTGDSGPVRCKRCKAYMCSFMSFIEGGSKFHCAFCKATSEVPEDYFCYLDSLGHRTDKFHRPELCLGSYEFLASKDYCKNGQFPNSPAYIFMIDVSPISIRNGMLQVLCNNLKEVLSCLPREGEAESSAVRVGFVTYNDSLHFYNVKGSLSQPQMLVVSDIQDVFVPILDGFLVTVQEAGDVIDSLLLQIPEMFTATQETEVILGPVMQAGLDVLKAADCPGKLLIFHSNLPSADAPGKLKLRGDPKLMGTDKEKTVLNPQSPFYTKLAEECVASGCSIDLFLFPNSYTDVATLGKVCQITGGQLHKYTYFQASTGGQQFLEDLKQGVGKAPAFDAVLRVRTSTGIRPINYFGNFFMSNTTDMELAYLDCYKSVIVEIGYDDKMQEGETAYIQSALLYTSCSGQRRLRIHNLAISTCTMMADVYRCCEMDAIVQYFARAALRQVMDQSPQYIRKNLIARSSKILACYRKNCANPSAGSQLILPDRMKLLPLYINCLLKSDAIAGGHDVAVDDRSFSIIAVNGMDVKTSVNYFYPRILSLHDLDVNSLEIPTSLRCSIEKINDHGAYLLENGIYMFLWIGLKISSEWLQDIFGVQTPDAIDVQKTSLMELNTPLSIRVREIISHIRKHRQWFMKMVIIRQGDKLDVVFRHFLVEDRSIDGKESYVDFVCHIHKEISNLIN